MATQEQASRIFWKPEEWYDVMSYLVPLRDRTGVGLLPALRQAQDKTLPKNRRRTESGLKSSANKGDAQDYEKRFRAGWVPEGRVTASTPAATSPDDGPSTAVRWNREELAMLALAIQHKRDNGDIRPLTRLYADTQAEILPPHRQRPIQALYVAKARLEEGYDAALRYAVTLPPELQAKLTGRGAEYEAHRQSTAQGLAETQAATVDEAQAHEGEEAPPAVAEGPSEPVAPLMAPALPQGSGDPLAARLSLILADAGARIAQETRAFVLAELDREMDALVAGMAKGMREHVRTVLAAELGGPMKATPEDSTPPPADTAKGTPGAAPPAAVTPGKLGKTRVRVDIVGLAGNSLGEVKAAAMRMGIDAYFIDADKSKVGGWTPRENVILATKFISHATVEKAKNRGVNLMFAKAGPQSVVGLLESLAEHRGALQ